MARGLECQGTVFPKPAAEMLAADNGVKIAEFVGEHPVSQV